MNTGRNDPCPCGSGRKFKKCHGALAIGPFAAAAPGAAETAALQSLDHELVKLMMSFRPSQYGEKWFNAALEAYCDFEGLEPEIIPVEDDELPFAMPWAFHSFAWGRTQESLAEHFHREKGRHLTREMRALLDAQLLAWCSFWRVDQVDPGVGLRLYDLLSQEERYVHERLGSTQIEKGTVILCRIVDVGDHSFIGGMHPYSAPLVDALTVVASAKRWARVRTRPVSLEFLRLPQVQGWMIGEWRWLTSRRGQQPTLSNTDGDPWTPTTDHLAFAPGDRNKAMENTVIGQINVTADRLRIETNSTRRGDALRAAVLAKTAPLVKHLLRNESSMTQLLEQAQESRARGTALPPRRIAAPEELAIIKEYKRRHYTAWLDDRIPALGGKTPRAAVRTAAGREQLDALLAQMAGSEARLPEEERFDFGWLRTELGL